MTKLLPLALAATLLACSSADARDEDVDVVPLRGNGEAGALDFLDPIHPLRGNGPLGLHDGSATVAVTRWIDVSRCSTHTELSRGEVTVCPGSPTRLGLTFLDASCGEAGDACDVQPVAWPSNPDLLVLRVRRARASVRVRVRVEEISTQAAHEDTFVLRSSPRTSGEDAGAHCGEGLPSP